MKEKKQKKAGRSGKDRQYCEAIGKPSVCCETTNPPHSASVTPKKGRFNVDFFFPFAVTTILEILKLAVRDPAKKASVRKALLKVANGILMAYPEDPDFQEVASRAVAGPPKLN